MDQEEKRKLILGLTDALADGLLRILDDGRIPERWEGYEIRNWIGEYWKQNYHMAFPEATRARVYRNDVKVKNLLT